MDYAIGCAWGVAIGYLWAWLRFVPRLKDLENDLRIIGEADATKEEQAYI